MILWRNPHNPAETEARSWHNWGPPPADFAKQGMTDQALAHLARIYMWSMATGDRPYGVLEREYGLARATTSRWIRIARNRGLIIDGEA